jgi:hypothetical protein
MDDDEYNLNIDDIDFYVKNWGKSISSAVKMIKTIYSNPIIFELIKKKLKRIKEI